MGGIEGSGSQYGAGVFKELDLFLVSIFDSDLGGVEYCNSEVLL